MDEQRLQEIENSIGRIDCPECEGGVFCCEDDGLPETCEACDGNGTISRFAPGHELIAEVRRLRQERDAAIAEARLQAQLRPRRCARTGGGAVTRKEARQFNQMRTALKRIIAYRTPSRIRATSKYGLTHDEAVQFAYECIQEEARAGLKGVRAVRAQEAK